MKALLPLFLLLFGSCSSTSFSPDPGPEAAGREPWDAPPLAHAVSVRTKAGTRIPLEELYRRLAAADVVFLGETHIDETTHRLQLGVYEAMLARRGEVTLAMEMFERDVQPELDRYLAGEIDEATFLASARPWGNYATAYRPLVETARAAGQRVIASNFPRSLRGKVMQEGLTALIGLDPGLAPAKILPNTRDYRIRTDNAVRGHIGMMGGPQDPDEPRLTSTQTLWDNAMGDACAVALAQDPGRQIVHVNGSFHSAYWDGTVRQLLLRAPKAKVATVAIVPASTPTSATVAGPPIADFTVFVERTAEDINDGVHAVHVSKKLRYALHVPESASADNPVPLLLWLNDDGLDVEDGLALWRDRGAFAVAVLEAPYRERQEDTCVGGRWFWVDRFMDDTATVVGQIEESLGYLLRHYPLDPGRVCLAGEGTGATMVAAATLLSDRLEVDAVALAPRRFAKIKDYPLPLPEYGGTPRDKSLTLWVDGADEEWWQDEVAAYQEIGFDSRVKAQTSELWAREVERTEAVFSALGLETPTPETEERFVALVADTPRARHWARVDALRSNRPYTAVAGTPAEREATNGLTGVELEVDREALARGEGLPRCPGAFGGTTVLVVLQGRLEPWLELEENDPLNAKSRFHRVRIAAAASGERELASVLEGLASQGRRNVLIVPVAFYAGEAVMEPLVESVRHLEGRMTLQWQAGLGGS